MDRVTAAVETPGSSNIDGVAICFDGDELPPLFMDQTVTITLRVPMSSQKYSVVEI
jgi:hypothetical protein